MKEGKRAFASFLFGGLLPVIAFTVIEEGYGLVWGIVAGMVFSVGEILWELSRAGRVSPLTWGGGLLLLALGGISLWASEGLWFKMQPALLEGVFCLLLVSSVIFRRPLFALLLAKQGKEVPPLLAERLPGLTLRVGIFFGAHALLATWAALYWSTSAWAWLKGVGFTVSFLLYMGVEILFLRRAAQKAVLSGVPPK